MEVKQDFLMVRKESLSESIHDRILEMIIKNPSQEEQVLNENRLVELFGVSKAPVREALIKLCSEGVLRSVPRYGYVVVQMNEKDHRDVIKTRMILEKEALRAAFLRIRERELEKIHGQIKSAAAKKNVDVWEVWDDNVEFHMLLAAYSDNQVLVKFLQECMNIQKRIYAQMKWLQESSMEDSVESTSHSGIYHALCDKDLERACQLLEQDIGGATLS